MALGSARLRLDPYPPVPGIAEDALPNPLSNTPDALLLAPPGTQPTDAALREPLGSELWIQAHTEEVSGLRARISYLEADSQRLTLATILARSTFWLVARYRFADDMRTANQTETCIEVPAISHRQLHVKAPDRYPPTLYELDRVFGPKSSNRDIYENVRPVIHAALLGRPAGLIVDGYSGTGESYTMLDGEGAVFTSVAEELMVWRQSVIKDDHEPSIRCSIVEVYQDQTFNLLRNGEAIKVGTQEDRILPQECFQSVDTVVQLLDLFETANRARKSAKTPNNKHSSRSHLIAAISLSRPPAEGSSTLFLVDLAGAERQMNAGTIGFGQQEKERLVAESTMINTGRTDLHRLMKEVNAGHDRRSNASHGPTVSASATLEHRPLSNGLVDQDFAKSVLSQFQGRDDHAPLVRFRTPGRHPGHPPKCGWSKFGPILPWSFASES